MKIAMINGSPKGKVSASGGLLQDLKSLFSENVEVEELLIHKPQVDDVLLSKMNSCDILVFAYPVYVDGIPSHLLSCLYEIEKIGLENENAMVFCIVNCGLFEGKHCAIAIEILKNWCLKMKLQWGMGIGFGGGGSIVHLQSIPMGEGPKRFLANAMSTMKYCIESKTPGEDLYISLNMPRGTYKINGEENWRKLIAANGGQEKDLGKRY